ncbi:M20 metallopeptidase family protein [Cloacibacillus sp.]
MDIDKRIDGMLPMLTAFRRELHEYPDLSGEEQPICARLAEILGRHGIEYKLMLDGTAAMASVGTAGSGKTVALRADTDALPLTEETGLPFASKKRGVMHACGHDIHTAAALGAAILLKEMEPELTGMVKIFFQPAEEGTGGAERMIAAGCLDVPHVSHVLGLHVNPAIAAGRAAFKFGKMHAASDEFTLILHGRGCHGAHPEEGCDAVAMAGQFITAIQNIASRGISPLDSAVVTVGKIEGGTKGNIIAGRVEMTGIMRSLSEETRLLLRRRLKETADGVADLFGGRAELILRPSYGALINDDTVTETVAAAARAAIGAENVIIKTEPTMGTEDFAYFAAARPSCFYELGCGFSDRETNFPLHSARFEADERCIRTGVKLQIRGALALLTNN